MKLFAGHRYRLEDSTYITKLVKRRRIAYYGMGLFVTINALLIIYAMLCGFNVAYFNPDWRNQWWYGFLISYAVFGWIFPFAYFGSMIDKCNEKISDHRRVRVIDDPFDY